ncbi:hypothetical protein SAMN02745857_01985 [Andreprevotia lacus DSM 23236]|jgi:hypothetical protein|uniref:Regulatory protein, RpfE type n=1 Tax=Andreprevotia lacus DSM 23236 TaxID=1121001 RepID=A0A1W1XLP3_9NEIS|nr:hypothetical protein [Andreprevotia lacus]SMC24846.1 hypothetical protein SAMN02745857_01985 [Andreprevotia lacus DSM 23236]
MNLHLVIPHADWPDAAGRTAIAKALVTPALTRLIGRGRRQPIPAASWQAHLASLFGLADASVAPLTLQADLPDAQPGYWLRADPVHLRPDRDQLVMLDGRAFSLTQAEADGLCAGLNKVFAEDGFEFVAATPLRWYLRLPADPGLTFTAFDEALGRNVDSLLPQGVDALRWHRLLNEMQMCLYAHPVNDARVAAGKPAINSVWPWGGGVHPLASWPQVPALQVLGDDALLAALLHGRGADAQPLPVQLPELARDTLALLPQLRNGALYGDAQAWYEGWQQLEQAWLAPALATLQDGRIASVTLTFPELGRSVQVKRSQLWHFWQRARWPWEA